MNLGRVGVITPGGGLKCAFQVGFFLAVDELGIKFEKVQGVSGGALNASKYVADGARSLKASWLEVEKKGYSSVFSRLEAVKQAVMGGAALYSDSGLWSLVGDLDAAKIISSAIRLEIVVWNEIAEKLEIIRNHEFNKDDEAQKLLLRRFIKASASFPGFFHPEEINGQVYSDGCGISSASMAELDTIFLVESSQPRITADPRKLAWKDRLTKRLSTLIDEEIEKDIKVHLGDFKLFPEEQNDSVWPVWRHLVELIKGAPKEKRLVLIAPSMNIPTLMMNYCSTGDISKSILHGYERTKETLSKLES